MADHFLSKIRVASDDFVQAEGRPVLERYDEVQALLTDRAGPEVAALFAEPLISKGNDQAPPTVSWYTGVEGDVRPLARLSPAERDRAELYLSEHLRPLRALAEDPATADLALGALSVYGSDDVVVAGDRPVIVNWGLMPDGQGANASLRPAHYAATLGSYLPLSAGLDAGAARADAGGVAAGAVAGAAMANTPPPGISGGSAGTMGPTDAPPPVVERRGITPIAWVPLVILLIVSGLFLVWLLVPGTRLFHARDTRPAITDEATLSAARALNESLRERQVLLETALDGLVCRPDGVLIVPGGLTPEGLTPPAVGVTPEKKAQVAPNGLLPNTPDRVLVPDAANGETSLLALIEARTVLIIVSKDGSVTAGSGFIAGPGLVMTNYHVIEDALDGTAQILVAGGALATPQRAVVLKSQGPLFEAGADFALLQIDDTSLPAFTVHLPSESLKLTNVVAAGFPGDVLEVDVGFAALAGGDLSAVPDLTVTDGTVNTEQQLGPETHVLMHSAPLSSGNSGGPLVDMCGRLVGVNTFVRQGKMQNRGFAMTTGDLLAFLNGTAAAPDVVSEPCAPVVVRPQVAVATPAADPKADQPASE